MDKTDSMFHHISDISHAPIKKSYTTPVLACFGDVRSLTASGSDGRTEGKISTDPLVCRSDGENALKGPCKA